VRKSFFLVMAALVLGASVFFVSPKNSERAEELAQAEQFSSEAERPRLTPTLRRPALAASQDSQELSEDFQKNPERVTLLLLSLHEEYQEDLQQFYQNELDLEPGQLARLQDASDRNVESEDLPLEAGVEVVSSTIFMGKNHWDYLQEVREILSDSQYKKFQDFHRKWKASLKQRDTYLAGVVDFPETQ